MNGPSLVNASGTGALHETSMFSSNVGEPPKKKQPTVLQGLTRLSKANERKTRDTGPHYIYDMHALQGMTLAELEMVLPGQVSAASLNAALSQAKAHVHDHMLAKKKSMLHRLRMRKLHMQQRRNMESWNHFVLDLVPV